MPRALWFGIVFIVRAGMHDLKIVNKTHVPPNPHIINIKFLAAEQLIEQIQRFGL